MSVRLSRALLTKLLSLAGAALLSGCQSIRVTEADLLRADRRVESALEPGQRIERHSLSTPHGEIAVTQITRAGNRVVMLYLGGNQFRTSIEGGDVVARMPSSVDLVLVDYPGYGNSSGHPSVDALMTTALAVYDRFLAAETGKQRIVYGTSTGGFVAAHVAGLRQPERLVLEGTAPDTRRWLDSMVPWFAKPFVHTELSPPLAAIDSVAALARYRGPILMMVGSRDTQTRPALMRKMAAELDRDARHVQFHVIPGRGHGEALQHPQARELLAAFVNPQSAGEAP